MTKVVDIESLLAALSEVAPCGSDLEYDPEFRELEQAATHRPERQVGDTIVPAQDPDWRDVRRRAEALLGRTKDLRVAIHLCRALLHSVGMTGLRDGLALLASLVEERWETVHPCLDPDDDNDATMRVNILLTLCDPTFIAAVRTMPLVFVPGVGPVTVRDHAIAAGELSPPATLPADQIPTPASVDGLLRAAGNETLSGAADTLAQALRHLVRLESALTARVGASSAANFDPLRRVLAQAHKIVAARVTDGAPPEPDAAASHGGDGSAPPRGAGPGATVVPVAVAGELRSRSDVVRLLDLVVEYYERHEPSSPVPVLVRRAKRLATMTFEQIVKDLVPDGMSQLEVMRGRDEDES